MPTAIVLGAAVRPDGQPSLALRRRTETAGRLFHDGQVDRIVVSGGVGTHGPAEAQVMCDVLVAMDVPPTAIVLEDRATNTLENLMCSKALLSGEVPVVVVSDIYHLPRALMTARRLGLSATGAHPPLEGTSRLRLIRSALREAPAYLWYACRTIPRSAPQSVNEKSTS